MLSDAELAAIRDENERRKELRDKATPAPWSELAPPEHISGWIEPNINTGNGYEGEIKAEDMAFIINARNFDPAATIDLLVREITELRLVLRDALQDNTPGNRVWREGVKAALEAAALRLNKAAHEMCEVGDFEDALTTDDLADHIRAIDPASILPTP